MFGSVHALITEWSLVVAAVGCLAAAGASFVYIPVFGRYIAACLVALSAGLASYEMGYTARGELDQSKSIQAQLDEANRQLVATQQIATAASDRAKATTDAADVLQRKIDDYETKIRSAAASAVCSLTADDVRSLSDIRDPASAGSPSPASSVRRAGSGSTPKSR